MTDLAERLADMRGENVSPTHQPGGGPGATAGDNLVAAAKDNRMMDRSGDDEAVSNLKSYRRAR